MVGFHFIALAFLSGGRRSRSVRSLPILSSIGRERRSFRRFARLFGMIDTAAFVASQCFGSLVAKRKVSRRLEPVATLQ